MSYKSLKDLYIEKCLGISVPLTPRQTVNFLTEGGAAGHMSHPFDLPQVRTGKDLIQIFEKAADSITTNPPAVKIDGVNASIKIVTNNDDGSIEFGLDRGSNKPLDVKGVTIADLTNRFEEGHGMINVGNEVLSIFNKALPVIKEDLAKLGFFKKNLLFNMEYVKGNTNVVGYADNFLAIHGINEVYEVKSPIRGSVSRATKEISYNAELLENLIEKVNKIAKNYGFKVYGTIPATVKNEIDFTAELNTELGIKYTPTEVVTKTLGAWLQTCKNPRGVKVTLFDGKKIDALSKFIYQQVLQGTALNELIKDGNKQMVNSCVCGGIFYHATRVLGQKILNSMSSPIGDIAEQEGIVIRDKNISATPFKITGNFIVRGMESKFANEEGEEGSIPKSYLSNPNYMLMPPFSTQGGKLRVGAEEGY